MDYNGASEYYFYQGLKSVRGSNAERLLAREPSGPDELSIQLECLEAFECGIELGKAISNPDYKELMTNPKIIKPKVEKVILRKAKKKNEIAVIDDINGNYTHKGNC